MTAFHSKAGLFSAVVTGFLVESAKSLRPEPLAATVAILERISAQLRNSSGDIPDPIEEHFVPTRRDIEINSLWFTSLILSLGVAFVGILVKQWLGEYSRGLLTHSSSRVSQKHARARQHRRVAFQIWHVHAVRTALPLVLLAALIVFCAGLSRLLISLDLEVGLVALCIIGFISFLTLATTVLPSLSESCPYRSPQALAVFICVQGVCWMGRACVRSVERFLWASPPDAAFGRAPDPEFGYGTALGTQAIRGPTSSFRTYLRSCRLWWRSWFKRTANKKSYWSWREREEATLLSCKSAHEAALLDEYESSKMDPVLLQDVIRPCLLSLPLDASIDCLQRILIRRADGVDRRGLPDWDHNLDRDTCQVSVDILLDMLEREELSFRGPLDESRKRFQENRAVHEQVLEIFQRLIFTRDHCTFLDERYERIFNILLLYIRKPQYEFVEAERSLQTLVFSILANLGDKIPPNAVNREGTCFNPRKFPACVA